MILKDDHDLYDTMFVVVIKIKKSNNTFCTKLMFIIK